MQAYIKFVKLIKSPLLYQPFLFPRGWFAFESPGRPSAVWPSPSGPYLPPPRWTSWPDPPVPTGMCSQSAIEQLCLHKTKATRQIEQNYYSVFSFSSKESFGLLSLLSSADLALTRGIAVTTVRAAVGVTNILSQLFKVRLEFIFAKNTFLDSLVFLVLSAPCLLVWREAVAGPGSDRTLGQRGRRREATRGFPQWKLAFNQ